jgi:hypothetical protein
MVLRISLREAVRATRHDEETPFVGCDEFRLQRLTHLIPEQPTGGLDVKTFAVRDCRRLVLEYHEGSVISGDGEDHRLTAPFSRRLSAQRAAGRLERLVRGLTTRWSDVGRAPRGSIGKFARDLDQLFQHNSGAFTSVPKVDGAIFFNVKTPTELYVAEHGE